MVVKNISEALSYLLNLIAQIQENEVLSVQFIKDDGEGFFYHLAGDATVDMIRPFISSVEEMIVKRSVKVIEISFFDKAEDSTIGQRQIVAIQDLLTENELHNLRENAKNLSLEKLQWYLGNPFDFINFLIREPQKSVVKATPKNEKKSRILRLSVHKGLPGMSERTYKLLESGKYRTTNQVKKDFFVLPKKIHRFGARALKEVKNALLAIGQLPEKPKKTRKYRRRKRSKK
jgi:hypothetical protein